MLSFMSWARVTPPHLTDEVRRRVLRACRESFDENSRRHSPEDLGDKASMFGQAVTYNARHLAQRELEEVEGVGVVDSARGWWIEFENRGRTYRVYLYKAPPGATSIHAVEFDSETKKELSSENSAQVKLVVINGQFTQVDGNEATHLVIVMFGSPEEGFVRAMVGAPFRMPNSDPAKPDIRWAWSEAFEDAPGGDADADAPTDVPGDSPDDFGIKLRPARRAA